MLKFRHSLLAASLFAGSASAAAAPTATGLFRGQAVTYSLVNGRPVFQGDIWLDHVTPLPRAGRLAPGVGVAYGQYLWPANSQGIAEIPYIVTSGATDLPTALSAFNATFAGIVQFVPRATQADYVDFQFDTGNSSGQCDSYVGRAGGPQQVGGSSACTIGTLLHEMGHVVGLYHEMSRPDRNGFVTLNFNNVIKGSEDNFVPLGDDYQNLGLFDYASVMMYIPFAFSRNGGPVLDTIPPGMPLSSLTGYSASDIDSVKRLYGAAPTQVTVASNPPGLSVVVDGTTMVTPKTYAWKLNSSHTLAVAAGAQTLTDGTNTYTYVYGRWNDSTAASHSIKVKPGNNTLSQPKSAPAITVYTANFVQLSSYTATITNGTGNIAVAPSAQSYAGTTGQFLVARQPVTLTATPTGANKFVTWGGINLPLSANPKTDYVPDGAVPYAVTAAFSTQPITTITTMPGGFYFNVDGYYYKGPQSFTADIFGSAWAPGGTHIITGYSPNEPYSVNSRYLFNTWSDGGALSHTITIPSGASTITGAFTAQYVPVAYSIPYCAANVTLKPNSPDGFYNAGTAVTVKATPAASGLSLTGWTGDLTGKKTSQILTVNDEEVAIANYNIAATPFAVTSLTPALFTGGIAGGTVKIKGNGFTATSAVFVNNSYRGSTFVSAKEIDVALTASDLATPGAFPIGVSNYPASGSCGNYAALTFSVAKP